MASPGDGHPIWFLRLGRKNGFVPSNLPAAKPSGWWNWGGIGPARHLTGMYTNSPAKVAVNGFAWRWTSDLVSSAWEKKWLCLVNPVGKPSRVVELGARTTPALPLSEHISRPAKASGKRSACLTSDLVSLVWEETIKNWLRSVKPAGKRPGDSRKPWRAAGPGPVSTPRLALLARHTQIR
jgi:hypothetical protein